MQPLARRRLHRHRRQQLGARRLARRGDRRRELERIGAARRRQQRAGEVELGEPLPPRARRRISRLSIAALRLPSHLRLGHAPRLDRRAPRRHDRLLERLQRDHLAAVGVGRAVVLVLRHDPPPHRVRQLPRRLRHLRLLGTRAVARSLALGAAAQRGAEQRRLRRPGRRPPRVALRLVVVRRRRLHRDRAVHLQLAHAALVAEQPRDVVPALLLRHHQHGAAVAVLQLRVRAAAQQQLDRLYVAVRRRAEQRRPARHRRRVDVGTQLHELERHVEHAASGRFAQAVVPFAPAARLVVEERAADALLARLNGAEDVHPQFHGEAGRSDDGGLDDGGKQAAASVQRSADHVPESRLPRRVPSRVRRPFRATHRAGDRAGPQIRRPAVPTGAGDVV